MNQRFKLAILLGFITSTIVDLVILLTAGLTDAILISPFLGGLIAGSLLINPIRGGGKAGIIIALVNSIIARPSVVVFLHQMNLVTLPNKPISGIESMGLPLIIFFAILELTIELAIGFGGGVVGSYFRRLLASKPQPAAPGVCPHCGAKIPLKAMYCPYCGAKVRERKI